MEKLTMGQFLAKKPNPDSVVAVRIKNGEWYFLAWMEDAEHYRIQAARDIDGYLMIKEILSETGDVYEAVQNTAEYNFMDVLYNLDDNGNVISENDRDFDDEYDRFLSLFTFGRFACSFNCEKRKNLQIIEISQKEIRENGDLLRDRDYIFIMEKNISKAQKESFEQECYAAYQLEWLLSHGFSLEETMNAIMEVVTDYLEDPENEFPEDPFEVNNCIYKCYQQFVNEVGFHGEFFACKDEFLDSEFQDPAYMQTLISFLPDSEKKMALWKEIMEGGEADEQ